MATINVIYGSTTGNTEAAAQKIAEALGANAINVNAASADDFGADVLILGTSTWGVGEMQDDWAANGVALLEAADLSGKKVAVFGEGDQSMFADSYCDAMGILAKTAVERGAVLIGKTSADGYSHGTSAAQEGDEFLGLALDENNQSDLTDSRIAAWVEALKAAL